MQIGRWGNSLAVRLPKSLVDRFSLSEGDELDSAAIEAALETLQADELKLQREQALREIAETRWTLPKDWKFDREEANAR
jgi:antitoxin MazE